jgi:type IV secretory pathway TrbF-like protein
MIAQLRLKKSRPDAASADSADSPFVAAKREWNERYGDYIAQARNWRLAAILSLIISVTLAAGTIWLAGQSKLVPYVVEVDKLGASIAVARADRTTVPNESLIRAQLANFVRDARSVSSDPIAERATLTRVYSFIGITAKPYLDDWYRTHSPFEAAASHTVAVTIDAVLPQSPTTYQVEWTEDQRDLNGGHIGSSHWVGQLTVGINPPTDEATILRNPVGIYVTQLSWTQQLDPTASTPH